jgi:hypothetical protein
MKMASRRELLQIFRAARIGHHERVDDRKLAAGRGQAEGAVPEIGDFVALQIKHGNLLSKYEQVAKECRRVSSRAQRGMRFFFA